MPNYDLHTHSWVSDGTLSPAQLVERAAQAGIDVLALTDHDDTAGCAEARQAAARHGLRLIDGVEVSVSWNGMTVHLVALGVDTDDADLRAGLERLRAFRQWRAEEIGRRLRRDAGIQGAYEGARALAKGRLVSRTHFAHFLVGLGRAKDVRDVFTRYLKPNKPGYVQGQWATLEEAIGWIRGAGGQAVLAHPARYDLTAMKRRRLLGEFKECGGEGLEVVSGSHSAEDIRVMGLLAREFELLCSAGSDYHGPENPWMSLGRLPPLPQGCTPIWSDAADGPARLRKAG